VIFFALRGALFFSQVSRVSPPHPKKIFLPFFVLPPSSFLNSIGPPPFLALSCKFSLSTRAAKNQSSMHSTTFDTKLFTFATCLCARFFCFREGINLATPASEGRLNFFFSPLFPNDIDVTKLTRQKIGSKIGAQKEQKMALLFYLLHVLDEGRLGRLVDFVDLDSLRGKGLLDSEHFY